MSAHLLPGLVVVTLSERNLKSLLVKMTQPSWRTIVGGSIYEADGTPLTNVLLVVRADETHDANRPSPDQLHPLTEQAVTTLISIDELDGDA